MIQVNNRLKEFQEKKNYSQDRLAKELGVSRHMIISIEKGWYNPSLPLALQIGKVFDAYVEEIFLLENENEK